MAELMAADGLVGRPKKRRRGLTRQEIALLDELPAELASNHGLPGGETARVGSWLVGFAGDDPDRRAMLADAAAMVARQLAPLEDPPPPGRWWSSGRRWWRALFEEAAGALARQAPGREQWSGAAGTQRLWLRPGDAVVLRARSTVHGWSRLDSNERRTMMGAGFASSP